MLEVPLSPKASKANTLRTQFKFLEISKKFYFGQRKFSESFIESK